MDTRRVSPIYLGLSFLLYLSFGDEVSLCGSSLPWLTLQPRCWTGTCNDPPECRGYRSVPPRPARSLISLIFCSFHCTYLEFLFKSLLLCILSVLTLLQVSRVLIHFRAGHIQKYSGPLCIDFVSDSLIEFERWFLWVIPWDFLYKISTNTDVLLFLSALDGFIFLSCFVTGVSCTMVNIKAGT